MVRSCCVLDCYLKRDVKSGGLGNGSALMKEGMMDHHGMPCVP